MSKSKTVKMTCSACGDGFEIASGSHVSMICNKCGSGDVVFDHVVKQICINNHVVAESDEAEHNCQKCPTHERLTLRKIVALKKAKDQEDLFNYHEMPEDFVENNVHQGEDKLWYFWDETQADEYGPFETRQEAIDGLKEYCDELEEGGQEDPGKEEDKKEEESEGEEDNKEKKAAKKKEEKVEIKPRKKKE